MSTHPLEQIRLRLGLAILAIGWTGVAWTGEASAQQPNDDPTCDLPTLVGLELPTVPDTAPAIQTYDRLIPYGGTRLNLGVGHLVPSGDRPSSWRDALRLPLFHLPGMKQFAWISGGWAYEMETQVLRPLGTKGLVETGYEDPSFIVYEVRGDWLRFRYAAGEGDEGTAWTHRCFLRASPAPLTMQRWEELFQSDEISPLYFRTGAVHALRELPDTLAVPVKWIPSDENLYHLDPLEVAGDWMRVRVVQPSDYCTGPEAVEAVTHEGWVRWRDDDIGPRLWYYTRGC
jgi:hypothetical protein